MKMKKKSKTKFRRAATRLPLGMEKTHEVARSHVSKGQPDVDMVSDIRNSLGAQGGLGPLNQEGEGELQNDQLAALGQIDPE
jgi:hypothetical protein